MLKESGRIVAIENTRLWVETINKGTCGACVAEKGCGQSLLSRWMARSAFLAVDLDGRDPGQFTLNDYVEIGIPEDVVVKSSLLIYILPLAFMVVALLVSDSLFNNEAILIASAVLGLLLGAAFVKLLTQGINRHRRSRPVLLDMVSIASQ